MSREGFPFLACPPPCSALGEPLTEGKQTACDIRLASADAVFSIRETKIALVADVGTLQRLPAIVGEGHVAELAFTGKDITAARAREIGLVNDVLPDPTALAAATRELAGEIAANSPLAVQGTKAVLRAGEGRSVPVVVLTAKDLTSADYQRLSGPIEKILRKGALGREQLLAEVSALMAGYDRRK